MSPPPATHRQDLVVGQPRSDADAQVECARIEWAGRVRIALIGLAGVATTTAGGVAWRLLG